MPTFRVALSGDFVNAHGQPAFPDFDLGPLEREPNLEFAFLPRGETVQAEDLEGFDALILLVPRITRESFPDDGQLAVVARFGVGFDTVDVDACTDNGVALVTTPDGVRRPVATAVMTLMLALTMRLVDKD